MFTLTGSMESKSKKINVRVEELKLSPVTALAAGLLFLVFQIWEHSKSDKKRFVKLHIIRYDGEHSY